MIKFITTNDKGEPGFGFGLSEENIKRLKAGQPIKINLADLGLKGIVVIFYGRTENEMVLAMKPFIGKDTKVNVEMIVDSEK